MGVLVLSDWGLRAQSGWIGRDRQKTDASQPFLANWVFPSKFQSRLQAKKIIGRAEDADSQDQRASLFFQAYELLRDKEDARQRAEILTRVCDECPDTPRCAEAWSLRLRAQLDKKPPVRPSDEMKRLVELIRRFGVGKKKISPNVVQDAVKALKKPYPDDAKTLQSALDAATPKKKPKKKK